MELVFLTVLVVLMVIALGSGYPVAFALPGSAILTIGLAAIAGYIGAGDPSAYFAHGGPSQWLSAGVTNFRGVYWEVERDTLIAIPLFIFMGIMLQRSKIAEDLLVTMAQLFGPIPGGLGISVVFVGALLAATTGIVGATVVAMGLISLPAMLNRGYSPALASGTICASGTLGQIIPPSIVLIILADQLASAVDQAGTSRQALFKESTGELSMPSEFGVVSTSAGDMFLGAFIPGILLVLIYMLFILCFALLKPKYAPAVERDPTDSRNLVGQVLITLVPPLALIFLVLGSIIAGIATVNQAGAIGAAGALIMAGYRLSDSKIAFLPAILALISLAVIAYVVSNYDTNIKNITTPEDAFGVKLASAAVGLLVISLIWSGWRTFKIEDTLRGVMIETAKTTSLVFIILLGAAMLTSAFRAFGGEELVKEFLNGLPGGFWTQFIIVMAVVFFLGFFLDFIEIAVVVVPIVAPILLADPSANVTAVWLGVMIGLNIQTSFLTPPFGFALFYLRGVAPASVRTIQIYKGVVAFIALQLLALIIVGYNPQLVNYLPKRLSYTAETAPPPKNPLLQYCLEEHVNLEFTKNGESILSAITAAKALDLSALPPKMSKELTESFDEAEGTFALMAEIKETEAGVAAKADEYRPIHQFVRGLERRMRQIDGELEELETDLRRADEGSARATRLAARTAELEAERETYTAQFPDNWEEEQKAFQILTKAENTARTKYRRAVDSAYAPVEETMILIRDADILAAQRDVLVAVQADLLTLEPEAAEERLKDAERALNVAEGTSDIKSLLSKARRQYRRSPDPEAAKTFVDEAVTIFDTEVQWRKEAARGVLPGLESYEAAIRDTIGLRQQRKMPRDIALRAAACGSDHRDISLAF